MASSSNTFFILLLIFLAFNLYTTAISAVLPPVNPSVPIPKPNRASGQIHSATTLTPSAVTGLQSNRQTNRPAEYSVAQLQQQPNSLKVEIEEEIVKTSQREKGQTPYHLISNARNKTPSATSTESLRQKDFQPNNDNGNEDGNKDSNNKDGGSSKSESENSKREQRNMPMLVVAIVGGSLGLILGMLSIAYFCYHCANKSKQMPNEVAKETYIGWDPEIGPEEIRQVQISKQGKDDKRLSIPWGHPPQIMSTLNVRPECKWKSYFRFCISPTGY